VPVELLCALIEKSLKISLQTIIPHAHIQSWEKLGDRILATLCAKLAWLRPKKFFYTEIQLPRSLKSFNQGDWDSKNIFGKEEEAQSWSSSKESGFGTLLEKIYNQQTDKQTTHISDWISERICRYVVGSGISRMLLLVGVTS
jgi:hypothetical protein